ncbi:hypothetical protein OESDEN_01381 [Oesophagostomum dentatum]|uniref:Reverse transcriptase domain-containing protein n=1 Tax=Oesophagostomum dentatum TaxID=61180 RepID=A0A0B1TS55_OESDE|nr:hypothetical protein OESDEN_01381 [Oesophagostomum dentatum]
MLKWGRSKLTPLLTELFNEILATCSIPEKAVADAVTVLLHKKGDPFSLKNYRPISILSVLYKLLAKVINQRLERVLDAEQPQEQAGFRRKYSTIDHLHAINELIERCREYRFPIFTAFIDYEKAFDTVEMNALWNALQDQGVHSHLIAVLRYVYDHAHSVVQIGETKIAVNIERGVRQGDPLSPKNRWHRSIIRTKINHKFTPSPHKQL